MLARRRIQISKEITISVIGGVGTASFPQEGLDNIEDYERVEVGIILGSSLVHPLRLGVSGFSRYFGMVPENLYGCVGSFVPWDKVNDLITAIKIKHLLPSDTKVEILD